MKCSICGEPITILSYVDEGWNPLCKSCFEKIVKEKKLK